MTHGDGGKGDKQRPTDHNAFANNYDRIFGGRKRQIAELVEQDNKPEPEDDEPEDEICSGCSGSGEGMYDGSTCYKCKGCGVEPVEKDDDV